MSARDVMVPGGSPSLSEAIGETMLALTGRSLHR
jgi:hypothetical protein